MVTVSFNCYDQEGIVVDSTDMDLTDDQVSDIINQAANVILARRDKDQESFELFLDELEEAFCSYSVIDDRE